jgi:hypothetical protein
MSAFTIHLQRVNEQLSLAVLKLDTWPDPAGYEHYALSAVGVASVISLDAGYWSKPGLELTQRPFFGNNNTFTNAELRKIATEIAKHVAYANQ